MKKLLLFSVLALSLNAQVIRNGFTVFLPAAPLSSQDCRTQYYNEAIDNNETIWVCNESTGAWTANNSAGVSVASGKLLTIDNSLEFAGTDNTKFTFPGATDTVTTLAATQTLTNKTLTSPVVSTISNTGTETLPSTTGGLPIVIACGATSGATANCANTAVGATSKVYFGSATLSSNASVITISPGFTSTSTYFCLANDTTTRANPVQAIGTSATTFTITNTTGASDAVSWACVGY